MNVNSRCVHVEEVVVVTVAVGQPYKKRFSCNVITWRPPPMCN